jgi:hypothetical protein
MPIRRRSSRAHQARLLAKPGLVLLAGCLTSSLTLQAADEDPPAAHPRRHRGPSEQPPVPGKIANGTPTKPRTLRPAR